MEKLQSPAEKLRVELKFNDDTLAQTSNGTFPEALIIAGLITYGLTLKPRDEIRRTVTAQQQLVGNFKRHGSKAAILLLLLRTNNLECL